MVLLNGAMVVWSFMVLVWSFMMLNGAMVVMVTNGACMVVYGDKWC